MLTFKLSETTSSFIKLALTSAALASASIVGCASGEGDVGGDGSSADEDGGSGANDGGAGDDQDIGAPAGSSGGGATTGAGATGSQGSGATGNTGTGAGGSGAGSGTGSGGAGSGSTNDCCADNATPGCADPAVESCVCGADPYCCNTAWDGQCAGAADSCGAMCGGGSSGAGGGGGSGAPPGCAQCILQQCNLQCILDGTCSPNLGTQVFDCLVFTCSQSCWGWTPPGGGISGGGQSACCSAQNGPGCSADANVEACVCAADPYCCNVEWDDLCAGEVESEGCGSCQ